MILIHKQTGHREVYHPNQAPWWCLLFGCLYFLTRENWVHATLSAALAIMTVGISWLLYPFFVNSINLAHYARRGYVRASDDPTEGYTPHQSIITPTSGPMKGFSTGQIIILAFALSFVVSAVMQFAKP